MSFTPRKTAPSTSNAMYYASNPFYQAGYGMPNCTCYAYGRFWEILGSKPTLSLGDAGMWFPYADGYERGQKAKLGAVACWESTVGGAGHVAIVEEIYSDGSILISQSAWQGTNFWTDTLDDSYYYSSSYKFQGFIYNPAVSSGVEIPTTWKKGNRYLSQSEMENNALIVYSELTKKGWSLNAIAGLLGNMESESGINPAIWQSLDYGNYSGGYGLVQWTPATNYTNWATSNGYAIDDGYGQLVWIDTMTVSTGQWIPTSDYNFSFSTFKKSNESPEYLASAFLKNFERAGVEVESARRTNAREWYNYLKDIDIGGGSGTPDFPPIIFKKDKGFNFVLFGQQRKKRYRC